MLPTPSTSHVNYDYIYEPAEDSYLLLDTISSASESEFLKTKFASKTLPVLVVEVGSGSGVVLAFATANTERIFGRSDVATIGTDINHFACNATAKTVTKAATEVNETKPAHFLGSINCDLVSALRPRSIDLLIFNPPYVPTESLPDVDDREGFEVFAPQELFGRDSHLLALSYAGGIEGLETTNRLLAQLPDMLSQRGIAYILLCKQNRPDFVRNRICAWPGGWAADIVGSSGKQAGWEKLSVLRIWRT